MHSWEFPEKMNPGQSIREYVEWNENVFKNKGDDAGDVIFVLGNSDMRFKIEARVINGEFSLKVFLCNFSTPLGHAFDLGWARDGTATFYLIEQNGQFSAPNLDVHWMSSNLALLGRRSLKWICIPGSHDSGMSERGSGTAFAHDGNTITQTTDVLGQLEFGARYFDIRPVISAGKYYTGHYGHILGSWQGANGQSIDSVVSQVNFYTAAYNELVVLNISHELNTDVGANSYRPFNQDEWNGLFSLLATISHLYVAPDPIHVDLTTLPLNAYIGEGKPAVIVVVEPECDLGEYAHRGFYKKINFNVYNSYSETNDLNAMMDDQIRKMQTMRPNPDASYFLLSWTLTQSKSEAAFCHLGADSILTLANRADAACLELFRHVTPQVYPNILYVDNLTDTRVADIAMEINRQAETDSYSSLLREFAGVRLDGAADTNGEN